MTAKPTATKQTIAPARLQEVELHRIAPSPFNPRTRFDEDALTLLSASIQEQGVLEPIIVRPITQSPAFLETEKLALSELKDLKFERFEIVAGERRFRAAKEARLQTIPCLIRELDDLQARIIAVTENKQRTDLDPLDEARGYQILKEGGMAQSDIADKLGISAGEVSKSLAMLELPPAVQDMVRGGTLSVGQARAIQTKWKGFPLALPVVAALVVERSISTRRIEEDESNHWQNLTPALTKAGVAREVGYDTLFKREECKTCPHKAFRRVGWSDLCLMPEEFDRKQEAARAEQDAKAKALVEKLHADKVARDGGAVGKKKDAPKLIELKSLKWDAYNRISDRDRPAGCTDACECLGAARDENGRACIICTSPKRYQALRAAESRAQNKTLRAQADVDKAEVLAWSVVPEPTEPGRFGQEGWWEVNTRREALTNALLAHKLLYSVEVKHRRTVAEALLKQNQKDPEEVLPLLEFLNTEGNKAEKCLGPLAAWMQFHAIRRELLMGACMQVMAIKEIERHVSWGNGYSSPGEIGQLLERTPLPGYEAAKKARAEAEAAARVVKKESHTT